jgi:hypothetical protein
MITKKKKQLIFWIIGIIFIVGIYFSWSEGFDSGFSSGYDYGYNQSSYDGRDDYIGNSQEIINSSIDDLVFEHINNCINFQCRNFFDNCSYEISNMIAKERCFEIVTGNEWAPLD